MSAATQSQQRSLSLSSFPLLERYTEVSSVSLGSHILSCSDEWFAPASDLLKVEPAPSLKGQFGPKGALFDGWETRRHNPEWTDWVILRLGPKGGASVVGFDVDTAHFNGNEAPEVEVFGLRLEAQEEGKGAAIQHDDQRWTPLLTRVPCGPSQRHLYSIPPSSTVTHIKLHMIPDGGIARFRVYGTITPPVLGQGVSESTTTSSSQDATFLNTLDLAHVLNGGRVVYTSDQHFGKGPNVLLPGRGHDMGDGWETKRSRAPGHRDWLVIKLGEPGYLEYCEIDTAHFLGNFPESVELHGIDAKEGEGEGDEQLPVGSEAAEVDESKGWTSLLKKSKTGPGKQHFFALEEGAKGKRFSHVRVTMHPDGGIKRVRIIGRRAAPLVNYNGDLPAVPLPGSTDKALPIEPPADAVNNALNAISNAATAAYTAVASQSASTSSSSRSSLPVVKAVSLTSDAFSPYGQVIAGPSAPGRTSSSSSSFANPITVNQGTAQKYPFQAELLNLFHTTTPHPTTSRTNMHLYRCNSTPLLSSSTPSSIPLRMLERHRFSSQSFIPLLSPAHSGKYLVVVALNHPSTDKPDLRSLKVFLADGSMGFAYRPGVWHLPMTPVGGEGEGPLDFVCVVSESEEKGGLNCDEHWWGEQEGVALLTL